MDDTTARLLEQVIDLKIERAQAALLAELQKLVAAHNQLAQTVIPELRADLARLGALVDEVESRQLPHA